MRTTTEMVDHAVEEYCKGINKFLEEDQQDVRYHPNQFRAHDYCYITLRADLTPSYYRLLVIAAYDGDDGGEVVLYTFWSDIDGDWTLHKIIQEFDTMIGLIWTTDKDEVESTRKPYYHKERE